MRRAVLFGNPLRRPHSAVMHNAAFRSLGIDAVYELREVDEDGLRAQVPQARSEGWLGFQVTAPHKRVVMSLLDEVEPAAARIGAVNTVELTADGRLVGFNTDTVGFISALTAQLDVVIRDSRVVVAGSGGVGHAVIYGLLSQQVADLTVLGRDMAALADVQDDFASVGAFRTLALDGSGVRSVLRSADLFVNATSAGMLTTGPVVAVDQLRADTQVFDVVYVPAETSLVRQARARGLPAVNGAGMLVAQAAAAFIRWTGASDPSDIMRAAVQPVLEAPVSGP